MNDIYVTAEYPNPPIRYIPIHQPCGIRVEEYTSPSTKEKIKAFINSIYGAKPVKRKETQEMKFGIGDHVKIKESVARSENLYPLARTGKIIAVNRFTDDRVYYIKHDGSDACSGWKESELELLGSYKGPAEFTKSDLKDGMVVQYRNGERALVLAGNFVGKFGFMKISSYNDDLIMPEVRTSLTRDYDICKVYMPRSDEACSLDHIFDIHRLDLIWKRKEEPKHKYKVGDKVKLRDDLATGIFSMSVERPMRDRAGEVVTIRSTHLDKCYSIEGSLYFYSEDMFEGLVDYEEMTVAEIEKKLGYKVKIVDGE
jgi:hypothetical protein